MAKIILDINEEKLSTVLNILENLKDGLINNISHENKNVKTNAQNIQNNKKYISKDRFKEKLVQRQRPEEDEFLVKSTSKGRYLSPSDFKNKLKKGKQ